MNRLHTETSLFTPYEIAKHREDLQVAKAKFITDRIDDLKDVAKFLIALSPVILWAVM